MLGFVALLIDEVTDAQISKHNSLSLEQVVEKIEVGQEPLILLNGIVVPRGPLHVDSVGQVGPKYLRLQTDVVARFQSQLNTLVVLLIPENACLVHDNT